jgi:hypothetical protein
MGEEGGNHPLGEREVVERKKELGGGENRR